MLNQPLILDLSECDNIVDILMYRSYCHNRETSPEVIPSQWRKLFINQEEYEEKYQKEKNEY